MKVFFASRMEKVGLLAVAASSVLLTACTISPTLRAAGPIDAQSQGPPGLRYHLAKDAVRVVATRTEKVTRRPKKDLSGPEEVREEAVQASATLMTVADTGTYYVLDATPGRWNDNLLTVKTSGEGLLQSVNSESTGQVGEFLKNVGQLVGTVAGLVLLDAPAAGAWPPEIDCRPIPALPADLIQRLFDFSAGVVSAPKRSALPQGRTAALYVLSDTAACELWQKLELAAYESDRLRLDKSVLAAQLRSATVKEVVDIKKRLDAAELALTGLAADRDVWLAAFRSGLEAFEKTYKFSIVTKTMSKTFDFDVEELPPDSIMSGTGELRDRLAPWPKAVGLYDLSRSVITLEAPGATTPANGSSGQNGKSASGPGCSPFQKTTIGGEPKVARLFYRQTTPQVVTVYGPDDDGVIIAKSRELLHVIDRKATHCVEFAESGMAVRKLKLEMDARGRPTLLDRSSTSSARATSQALAGAFTALRDSYADTLTKVTAIQQSRRQIALDDLESELARLKKQKEIVDADIGLQGVLASRESTLEQQRLAAELAVLQARLNLETTQTTYADALEVAQLKAEIERLKQELELLRTQLALSQATGG